MLSTRLFPLVLLVATFLATGCRSFEETVRPITQPVAPKGYVPPAYIKGVKPIGEVDPNALTMEVWRLDADAYPDSVELFVRVFDRDRNLVTNLAPPYYRGSADYRTIWSGLKEQLGSNGPIVPVNDFTVREVSDQDGVPYELALVLDYSGSMATNIADLEAAARAFVRLKRPNDRITVVKFGREPKVVATAETSESALLANFTENVVGGHGYYSTMYAATQIGSRTVADAPKGHPRAVVVFTDGEDNASATTAANIFEFSLKEEVPIFAVGFGAMNREVLDDLTRYTGGRLYQTYSPAELTAAFEDIYRNLRNYYVISYRPPRAGGRHLVTIGLNPPGGNTAVAATAEYNTVDQAGPIAFADTITVDEIYFDYDRATLRSESMGAIETMVEHLQRNPRLKIEVQGHTDSRGGAEYNQKLSENRAAAVVQAIIDRGVDPKRLRSRGFGFNVPKAPNDTDEGRQRNRRTEFVVLAR